MEVPAHPSEWWQKPGRCWTQSVRIWCWVVGAKPGRWIRRAVRNLGAIPSWKYTEKCQLQAQAGGREGSCLWGQLAGRRSQQKLGGGQGTGLLPALLWSAASHRHTLKLHWVLWNAQFLPVAINLSDHGSHNTNHLPAHALPSLIGKSSVQSLSRVQLFAAPWTAACQASLSTTSSRSLLKIMSIESWSIQPSHRLPSPSSPAFNLSQRVHRNHKASLS